MRAALGAWRLALGAWRLALGAWSLELGAGTGETRTTHGRSLVAKPFAGHLGEKTHVHHFGSPIEIASHLIPPIIQ